MTSSTPTRTILVLHGYTQNAHIFSKRLGALRKQCGKNVELVFINGPIELDPADLVGSTTPQETRAAPAESAASTLNALGGSDEQPRAWWRANADRTRMVGLEKTLDMMRGVLSARRFDGVLGFSQGGALAAVLAALLERPHLYPPFLIDGASPHPPFKFCVSVSGFRASDPLIDKFFDPFYETPTLHVIGKTDIVVIKERSSALIGVAKNSRVEYHEGGHFVPSKANWRHFLANYLANGPDGVPGPLPTSGTSTPAENLTRESTPALKL